MSDWLQPGIHEIDVDEYHEDRLTPEPALSASGIVTLLNETPAHFLARNPRLSPWPIEREETDLQKLGAVVHRLLLDRGSDYKVIDPSEFKNKDGSPAKTFANAQAKAAKETAEAQGFVVIDQETFGKAQSAAAHARASLEKHFGEWPIGRSEQTMIWQRRTSHGPIWCRALVDHLAPSREIILDIKGTSRSVSESEIAKKIAADGTDIQAAHYLQGFEELFPNAQGRTRFIFVFVEFEPPFSVRRVPVPESWLTLTHQWIDIAAERFADALRNDRWPAYDEEASIEIPAWHEARITQAITFAEVA